MQNKFYAVLGPTASGKSSYAILLAKRINAEIICCDSMQVYQEIPIGTAQVSKEEQQEVRHHLLGFLSFKEKFDSHSFVAKANEVLADIFARGKNAILCGGTGLYAKLFLYQGSMQPSDRELSTRIRKQYQLNPEDVYKQLFELNPDLALQVRDNPHRLCRALEIELLGKNDDFFTDKALFDCQQIVLLNDSSLQRELIFTRAKKMLKSGWLDEAEEMIAKGLLTSPTASKALGYNFIDLYFKGELTYDDLLFKICTATCRYAKRQRTWFRHQHKQAVYLDCIKAKNFFDSC